MREQTQQFATALLDHARTSYELEVMLNYNPTGENWEPGERQTLDRLKLAIKYKQKQVCICIVYKYNSLYSNTFCIYVFTCTLYRVSNNSRPTVRVHVERVKPSRKVLILQFSQ